MCDLILHMSQPIPLNDVLHSALHKTYYAWFVGGGEVFYFFSAVFVAAASFTYTEHQWLLPCLVNH